MYTGIIRIQNSVNVYHLKGISRSMDYLKMQSSINSLKDAVLPLYNLKLCETQAISKCISSLRTMRMSIFGENWMQNVSAIASNLNVVLSNCGIVLQSSVLESFKQWKIIHDKNLFLKIADELGFPIYLEMDTELQDRLIYSYKSNDNQCNKKEMCQIILDYYNDECIAHILNGIKNVQVFNSERVVLIEEGIETYELGLYASSASLFATQLSGMIRDVYNELIKFQRIPYKEKKDLIVRFNQNCKPDSEKGMLLQIVNCQSQRFIIIGNKVLQYFLGVAYSTKENDIDTQPNRNMICHGKQTNYNTKEMNLKLILCMDIIAELAWRVKKMQEEYSEIVIDV
ncbi:MAG: hypothetical protein HFH51_16115 [Lachnospiraceae bacterium]|nr:hypothetical protein [Lachnospiraceae bacterium]